MTKDEALKMCLEYIETNAQGSKFAILIKEALAQPEQEPVAFENWHKANYVQNLEKYGDTYKNNHVRCRHQGWLGAQSITPQRTLVGLTKKEFQEAVEGLEDLEDCWVAIEAKIKDKNT